MSDMKTSFENIDLLTVLVLWMVPWIYWKREKREKRRLLRRVQCWRFQQRPRRELGWCEWEQRRGIDNLGRKKDFVPKRWW